MATQEISTYDGVKNIPIPRRNTHIKTAKQDGSGFLMSRSTVSIANTIPSILYVFSLNLFEIENFSLGIIVRSGGSSHQDKLSHTDEQKASERKGRTKKANWWSGREENERQLANKVNARDEFATPTWMSSWLDLPARQRCQKFFCYGNKSPSPAMVPEILMSSLELALVFPLKRKGWCNTGAVSTSLSLRTKVSIQ